MPADLSVFHDFAPPPTGGGHQVVRALCAELERRGIDIEYNRLSRGTPVCFCNSYNFNGRKLGRLLRFRRGVRCVHRIDGPMQLYRGFDDGSDRVVSEFNRRFASTTVYQSEFSLKHHLDLGLSAVNPVRIPNTPDPGIFHPPPKRESNAGGKLRVISTSWSDNPNKGLEIYQWLDDHLDFSRVDYTFVGRIQTDFKHIRHVEPLPSGPLADLLRRQGVYLTASRNDPSSNSVIEALACGLPVVYLDSGGHPELVGKAGLSYRDPEEVPDRLDRMREDLSGFRREIRVPAFSDVVDAYAIALGL